MHFLGVDLGSSYIKGGVLDLEGRCLRGIERLPFPEPVTGVDPTWREYDPGEIVAVTRALMDRLDARAPGAAGIVMSSQMHGMILAGMDGRSRTRFISWQDQRTLSPMPDGRGSAFDQVRAELLPEDWRALGNEPRPGVPLCHLVWLSRLGRLPAEPVWAASLPGWVVSAVCGGEPVTDVTQAHGYGLLDLQTLDWRWSVLERLGLGQVRMPSLVSQGQVVGRWPLASGPVPVHAAVGDFHAAQVGACLKEGELSVNVSTGSGVVLRARGLELGEFQTRPWVDGGFLKAVTHIPGGRALNALVRWLTEIPSAQGLTVRDPWDYVLGEAEKVERTGLKVNPAFYFGSMGDAGSITSIREHEMTVGHLFRATFDAMAANYEIAAGRVDPGRGWRRVVFSGGVALKTPMLRRLICERLGLEHRLAPNEEDVLVGLLALALAYSGRAGTVEEAMGLLGAG